MKWWKEWLARREVNQLRDRVLAHWSAVGIDQEWTTERDLFFLDAARCHRGLSQVE